MENSDAFYTSKEEVIKSLASVSKAYHEWRESLVYASETLSINNNDKSAASLRKELRSLQWDVDDLQETINIAEKNPEKYVLSSSEITSRKQFVDHVKEMLYKSKKQLANPEMYKHGANVINFDISKFIDKKPSDFTSMDSMRNAKPKITSDLRGDQETILAQQDERLDQLGSSIMKLKGMSQQINTELDDQVALLEDFSDEMSQTDSKLDATTKRIAKLLHLSSDRRQWSAILGLSVTLFIILLLLAFL